MQIKSVAEDAGVNDEDMSKAQKALKRLNIDIEKSTGDLKPLNEILQEVASKWEGLTDVEKQYTSEMLAGNRQRSTFVALMESMTRQQELYNDALNSDGAAEKANEIKAKSIEGLTNTLKTQTNIMWSSLINSDMIKGFITGMTTIVNTISTAIDKFGAFGTTLGLLTTIILLFKGKALATFLSGLYGCVAGENALTVATVSLQLAFEKLKSAILSNPLGAIALGITTVATAFSYFSNKIEQAREEVEEFNKSFNEDYGSKINNVSNAEKLLDNYKSLSNELKSLQSGTNEYKAKEEELKNTQEQLVSIYPEINNLLNDNKNGKQELIDKTQELINKDKELQSIEARKALGENKIDSFSDFQKQVEEYKKLSKEMNLLIKADNNGQKTIKAQYWSQYGSSGVANVKNRISEVEEEINNQKESLLAITNAYQVLDKQGTQYEGLADKTKNTLNALGISFDDVSNNIDGTSSSLDDISDTLTDTNGALEETTNSVEDLVKAFTNANDSISLIEDTLKEYQENSGVLSGDTIGKILSSGNNELIASLGDKANFEERLNNLLVEQKNLRQQNYEEAIKQANAEINATQQVSNENANSYNTDVQNKVNAEQAKANATQKSAENQNKATVNTANQNAKVIKTDTENLMNALNSKLDATESFINGSGHIYTQLANKQAELYKKDYDNYDNMTQKKWGLLQDYLKKDYSSHVSYYDKYVELQKAMNPSYSATDIQKQWEANAKLNKFTYDPVEATFNPVNIDPINIGSTSNPSSSSSAEKDYSVDDLESLYDRYLKINTAIDMLNNNLEILKEKQGNLVGSDYLNSLKQEINSYKEQQKLIKQKISEQDKERWDLRVKLDSAGFKFDDNDINSPILNYESQIKALTNSANAMADSDEKSAEAKKKAQERVKDLNEAIKDYNTLIGQTIPATQKEWEALNNSIKSVYETMSNLVADGESKMYDIFKYYADKRTDKLDEQMDLLDRLHSKETEQEDLTSKQSELAKIKEQMNLYELDNSANGQAKLKELREQYDELLKEMNTTIKDNQYEGIKQQMEDEKQAIEDSLKPENINSLINKALTDGFIKVGNETINLNNAINDMVSNTVIGFQNIIKEANESNDAIKNAMATIKDVGISGINSNLGYDTSAMTTAINNSTTNKATYYSPNYTINVEANGVDEQTVSKMIVNEIKEYDKTWK